MDIIATVADAAQPPRLPSAARGPAWAPNSKDDYDVITETAYLLRNPANAERLLEAIERARRGEYEQHDLHDA